MFLQNITAPSLSLNTYILGNTKSKSCIVVDPPRLIAPCLAAVQTAGLTVTHILETHVHADFISGAIELKYELDGKPLIYASGMGGAEWTPIYADKIVSDGDCIQIGSIRLQAVHTPGHSPEHVMWVCYDEERSKDVPWFAFTGDLLFVGGVGRPDLIDTDATALGDQLYHSLFEKIQVYPDFMEIFPSHFHGSVCGQFYEGRSSSTLGFERRFNPYLNNKDKKVWKESIQHECMPYASHLKKIKKMNLQGPVRLDSLATLALEGSIDEIDLNAFFVIDTRPPQKFANYHLKDSINIPIHDSFCQWCTWFVPDHCPLIIVVEDHYRDAQIVSQLRLVGFDQPVLIITLSSRMQDPDKGSSLSLAAPHEVQQNKICIVDVRNIAEWNAGHVPGSLHIELSQIAAQLKNLPSDRSIMIICRSGMRSAIAASILQKNGCQNVASIQGGIQSWIAAGLPLEK